MGAGQLPAVVQISSDPAPPAGNSYFPLLSETLSFIHALSYLLCVTSGDLPGAAGAQPPPPGADPPDWALPLILSVSLCNTGPFWSLLGTVDTWYRTRLGHRVIYVFKSLEFD